MGILKCKMCGGDIRLWEDRTCGTCDCCGSAMTFPRVKDENVLNLFNRANHFRRQNEYDKAIEAYDKILESDPENAEAYWGLVLSRYGIEYVKDPKTHERIPTCHRVQITSILADPDYLRALQFAPDRQSRALYEQEAQKFRRIQQGILKISARETPYDVFICYKEAAEDGRRTLDSTLAQTIYYHLTDAGLKVFFSRITLENKLGHEYEPYIFAALNSAKVMLVIGTRREYFEAVWVKNEWHRYLMLMKSDRSRLLIPCYRDMDPYDLPEELSVLQSQDMSQIGFLQDIIRGVRKVLNAERPAPAAPQDPAPGGPDVSSLLRRAQLFLEDGAWERADQYFDRILDISPEYAPAYIGKIQAQRRVAREADLAGCGQPLTGLTNYQKALRFADERQRAVYAGYNQAIVDRLEEARRSREYWQALRQAAAAEDAEALRAAADLFQALGGYRDAAERRRQCLEDAESCARRAREADERVDQLQRWYKLAREMQANIPVGESALAAVEREMASLRDEIAGLRGAFAKAKRKKKSQLLEELDQNRASRARTLEGMRDALSKITGEFNGRLNGQELQALIGRAYTECRLFGRALAAYEQAADAPGVAAALENMAEFAALRRPAEAAEPETEAPRDVIIRFLSPARGGGAVIDQEGQGRSTRDE